MSDLFETQPATGGIFIVGCACALRFHLFELGLQRFGFDREHISFLHAALWFVIAGLAFVILRQFGRNLLV